MEEYVKTRLERNTDFSNLVELSVHPDLTLDILLRHRNFAWNYPSMIFLPQFNVNWVANFPSVYWNWNELSKIVKFEEIKLHKNLPWNWAIIAERLTLDEIMQNSEMPWDFHSFMIKKITPEKVSFFRFFADRIPGWKWSYFARCLTWDALRESTDLPWILDIDKVSSEETFIESDIQLIKSHIDDCNWIDLTIYVSVDIIDAHPTLPWRRDYLIWNRSTWRTKITSIEFSIREWTAVNKIKRQWKKSITDPAYKLCKSRLLREFKEMEN